MATENDAEVNPKPSEPNSEGRTQTGGTTGASTLGEQLRRAREQRGVSLREISDHTRISMRHLEAIEADDYKNLPGGIFNRSFIKAYARHVRFDEERALSAYAVTAREHGETPDEVATSPTRSRIYMDGETTRSPIVTALLSALILGILILVIYAGLHWYRRTETNAAPPAAQTTAPAGNAVTGNPTTAQNGQNTAQTANGAATSPGGFKIQLKAKGEPVWISARADEDKPINAELKSDEMREFAPQTRLSLKYARVKASSLEVLINGQPAQPPLDGKGSSIDWVITKEDFKQFLR